MSFPHPESVSTCLKAPPAAMMRNIMAVVSVPARHFPEDRSSFRETFFSGFAKVQQRDYYSE